MFLVISKTRSKKTHILRWKKWSSRLRDRLVISSNINEVIRTVLNFLFFFLTKRFRTHQKVPKSTKSTKKHQKHKKHKNVTKQKHKNTIKRTKIKNAIKKWKKSLIRLFAFLCLRRKKQESLYNRNVRPTKPVKVLSALYEQKLVY